MSDRLSPFDVHLGPLGNLGVPDVDEGPISISFAGQMLRVRSTPDDLELAAQLLVGLRQIVELDEAQVGNRQ